MARTVSDHPGGSLTAPGNSGNKGALERCGQKAERVRGDD